MTLPRNFRAWSLHSGRSNTCPATYSPIAWKAGMLCTLTSWVAAMFVYPRMSASSQRFLWSAVMPSRTSAYDLIQAPYVQGMSILPQVEPSFFRNSHWPFSSASSIRASPAATMASSSPWSW